LLLIEGFTLSGEPSEAHNRWALQQKTVEVTAATALALYGCFST
jgi:hypothetical protein